MYLLQHTLKAFNINRCRYADIFLEILIDVHIRGRDKAPPLVDMLYVLEEIYLPS